MTVAVTKHAVDRYIERIAPVSRDEARRTIAAAAPIVEFAVGIGARTVRLGNGAKLCLVGRHPIRVVTVIKRNWINAADRPRGSVAGDPAQAMLTRPAVCITCAAACDHPSRRSCTRSGCPFASLCSSEQPS